MQVIYHPISNFKVKPITRSSSSMYGHTQAVLSLHFSPDCKNLASGSGDGTLRLWDINIQTPLKQIQVKDWVMIVQWSPDAQKVAFAEKNGIITVYCLENEGQVKLQGHTKWITSLVWIPLHLSSDCNKLISSSKDTTLRLWNTLSGVCLRSFGFHTKCITKVLWSGQGYIYSCSEDQKICIYNQCGNFIKNLKMHSHWVNTMSLSSQNILRCGCYKPYNLNEKILNKQVQALKIYKQFTKNHHERLVSGSDDFTLILFNLQNDKLIKQMTGHTKPVNHVQFSPDGRYIISGSFDKRAKLWDGYSGQFMYTFDGHVGSVYLLVWSPDSRFVVSASQDTTLKLWDIKTRKLMMNLPGHADQIYALDWNINGDMVASGGKDRQVKLWKN